MFVHNCWCLLTASVSDSKNLPMALINIIINTNTMWRIVTFYEWTCPPQHVVALWCSPVTVEQSKPTSTVELGWASPLSTEPRYSQCGRRQFSPANPNPPRWSEERPQTPTSRLSTWTPSLLSSSLLHGLLLVKPHQQHSFIYTSSRRHYSFTTATTTTTSTTTTVATLG